MFHLTTCPTCQTKFTVAEAAMGKRQVCPHCQSPFLAGKSVAEAEVPMKLEAGGAPAIAKTMLGETAPPIKYNCPRCKMPLEAPSIEAGTKKPCPGCGQRLQVPAAPPAAAPQPPAPALNKTMLAETEPPIKYNCPTCKKPLESPALEAGTKKPCPACGQRLQIPMASVLEEKRPNLNKTILAADESKSKPTSVAPGTPALSPQAAQTTSSSMQPNAPGAAPQSKSLKPLLIAGGAVGGLLFLGLFSCVIVMVFTGPSRADREKAEKAQKDFEKLLKDHEELKKSIKDKEELEARQRFAAAQDENKWKEKWNEIQREKEAHEAKQKELERRRENDRILYANDVKMKAENDRRLEEIQQKLDQEKADNIRKQQEAADKQRLAEQQNKAALDAIRADIQNSRNQERQQTVIISQPPQPVYYPPFHPFGPYGWRGW